MEFVDKSAKTVDEAITEALIELGTTSDQVDIEVLDQGSKGIFGLFGGKEAKVRVTKRQNPDDIAIEFLENLFKKMNMAVDIECKLTVDNQLNINLSGQNMGILIGKRGNTLDSLQYLISLVVNKNFKEYIRVKLDTEKYRSRRKETLENLARNLSKKVRSTGRKVQLEPMNPFERRIIHYTLQNDRYVETHSEGEEPYRKVVITLKRRN